MDNYVEIGRVNRNVQKSKSDPARRYERKDYTGDGEREAEQEALTIARPRPQRDEDQSIAGDQLVAPGQELAESLALLGREIATTPLHVSGERPKPRQLPRAARDRRARVRRHLSLVIAEQRVLD